MNKIVACDSVFNRKEDGHLSKITYTRSKAKENEKMKSINVPLQNQHNLLNIMKQKLNTNAIKANITAQEIDLNIMNIFTSPKWSDTSYLSRFNTVNVIEKNEMPVLQSDLYTKDTNQEEYVIDENENIPKKSIDSSQLSLGRKINLQNSVKSLNKNIRLSNEFSKVHSSTDNTSKNIPSKTLKSVDIDEKSVSILTSNEDVFFEDSVLDYENPLKVVKDDNSSNGIGILTNSPNIENEGKSYTSSKTLKSMDIDEKSESILTSNKYVFLEDSVLDDENPLKIVNDDNSSNEIVIFANSSNIENAVKSYSFREHKSEEVFLTTKMDINKKTESQITSTISNEDAVFKELLLGDKKMSNMTYKNNNKSNETVTLTNPNYIENEGYYYRIYSEEHETSLRQASTFTSRLSSKVTDFNQAFMNSDFEDVNYNYNSKTFDSSSSWSLNSSTITRVKSQAQSRNLMAKKQSEELAINKAVNMIMKKAKKSLGQFLVEGLYEVSKNYRHDPFRCLGIWLLVQADIRDEHKIEQDSHDSNEDLSVW